MEGISLKPLLANPNRQWKRAVFSQYPRARKGNRHRGHGDFMGYSVRTDRYRYVEWREWEANKVVARELYDHNEDPNETRNVAALPDYVRAVSHLSRLLERGWREALPIGEGR